MKIKEFKQLKPGDRVIINSEYVGHLRNRKGSFVKAHTDGYSATILLDDYKRSTIWHRDYLDKEIQQNEKEN